MSPCPFPTTITITPRAPSNSSGIIGAGIVSQTIIEPFKVLKLNSANYSGFIDKTLCIVKVPVSQFQSEVCIYV